MLREVGELLVVAQRPVPDSRASTISRTAHGGGVGQELELLRLDVVASATGEEVTTYGERACLVDRAPKLGASEVVGARLYERVPVGTVRVMVEELRSHPATVHGLIRRGDRLELSVPLEPLDFAGSLSGTIMVKGPFIADFLTVIARSIEDPRRTFQTTATPMGGAFPGERHEWRIDDLPLGAYQILPMPESIIAVEPSSRTVEAPAEGLDFVVRNDGEVRWCDWCVVDASSGAPLEDVWVDLERRDGKLRSVRLDRSPAECLRRTADVRWTVRCEGYESATGTLAACNRAEPRATRTDPLELGDKRMQEVWVCDLELVRTSR